MFNQVKKMPSKERIKFFALIATNAFRENDFTDEQVFGNLKNDTFTAEESAQYLEISMPTFRRHVQSGKLIPKTVVGRSQFFATGDLQRFKQELD